jgi:hypothetical protein
MVHEGYYNPPLKEISSRDYEGRGVIGKQRTVIKPLLWSQRHEGRSDHFLNSRVGNMPTIGRELGNKNELRCGANIDNHCLATRMKDGKYSHL